MVLAMNIGNTNFSIGIRENERIKASRYPSVSFKSKRDFIKVISQFTSKKAEGVIISSVIPELTNFLTEAIKEMYQIEPVILSNDMKMTVDLSGYDTSLIGSDRIAVCEAAAVKYKAPLIVFDFGTAVTVNVINQSNCFLGGAILPGLTMGLNALTKDTAQLPKSDLSSKAVLIGRNTKECLISGAVYGNTAMLDGMIQRIEMFLKQKTNVLITGGNALDIISVCFTKVIYEPELLLEGLFLLYKNNM